MIPPEISNLNHHIQPVDPIISDVWKRRIVIGGLALGIFLGTAAAAAGTGSLLSIAGTRLVTVAGTNTTLSAYVIKNIGTGMIFAGNGLFLAGKYAFLSIAVPAYTVGWVIPKWIVTKGAPEALQLSHDYVIIPICNGIIKASVHLQDIIVRVAQTIYDKILIPFMEQSWKFTIWTWNNLIVPSMQQITRTAQLIADRFLKPVLFHAIRMIDRAWQAVVIPIAKKIVEGLSTCKEYMARTALMIYNHVMIPFHNAIRWSWSTIIIPVAKKINDTVLRLNRLMDNVMQTFYSRILVPLAETTVHVLNYIKDIVVIPVMNGVVKATSLLNQVLAKTTQSIYDFVLVPLANGAYSFFAWSWNNVLIPSFEIVKATSQMIFEKCIIPLAIRSLQFINWSWNSALMPIFNGIVHGAHFLNQKVLKIAQAIYDYVLLPVGGKILEGHALTIHYGGILYDWTTDAISNIYQTVLINSQAILRSVQNTYQWVAGRV